MQLSLDLSPALWTTLGGLVYLLGGFITARQAFSALNKTPPGEVPDELLAFFCLLFWPLVAGAWLIVLGITYKNTPKE